MRFLLDEDLGPEVAAIARGLGLDVVSVHEVDRRGLGDLDQLRYAAAEGRILVTRNRDDYIRLTIAFFQTSEPHCGVLIVPRSLPNHRPKRLARALGRWHDRQQQSGGPGTHFIDFLPGGD